MSVGSFCNLNSIELFIFILFAVIIFCADSIATSSTSVPTKLQPYSAKPTRGYIAFAPVPMSKQRIRLPDYKKHLFLIFGIRY